MAKRKRLLLSKTAQRDIETIDFYSFEKWGEATAQAYVAELEARLRMLCDMPMIGADRSDLRPGYRVLPSGRHLIYYRIEDEFVYVLTIQHHSQDHAAFRERKED